MVCRVRKLTDAFVAGCEVEVRIGVVRIDRNCTIQTLDRLADVTF